MGIHFYLQAAPVQFVGFDAFPLMKIPSSWVHLPDPI